MNSKAIKDRLASLLKDKSSGIQPEFQNQLFEIIKRIEEVLRDNHGECEIPDDLIKEIARCLIEKWEKTHSPLDSDIKSRNINDYN